MRIVWKDSKPKVHKPVKYRGHFIEGYNGGWTTSIPGDDNIYKTHYCALNAIDKALGGHGQKGLACQQRLSHGIEIIGKKDGETA